MNTNDITERYREDPADPRVLEERRIDAILHVTPAHAPPNEALIKLIAQAVNQSRDPRVKSKYLNRYPNQKAYPTQKPYPNQKPYPKSTKPKP